jgi:hypothetical protein
MSPPPPCLPTLEMNLFLRMVEWSNVIIKSDIQSFTKFALLVHDVSSMLGCCAFGGGEERRGCMYCPHIHPRTRSPRIADCNPP